MKYIMYQQYQIALAQEMSTVTISIIISITKQITKQNVLSEQVQKSS